MAWMWIWKPEFVDPTGRLGQRVALPHLHAVVVQARAVRRQQRAGLVLDDPVGKELDGVGRQQRRARVVDAAPRLGERRHLGVEVARIGVEARG